MQVCPAVFELSTASYTVQTWFARWRRWRRCLTAQCLSSVLPMRPRCRRRRRLFPQVVVLDQLRLYTRAHNATSLTAVTGRYRHWSIVFCIHLHDPRPGGQTFRFGEPSITCVKDSRWVQRVTLNLTLFERFAKSFHPDNMVPILGSPIPWYGKMSALTVLRSKLKLKQI